MEEELPLLLRTTHAISGKDIPTSNVDLHYAHCIRNLERCTLCGHMVPKRNASEHYYNTHAPVDCSLCSEKVEREALALHRGEKCPQRIVTCEYCEFPLTAVDLFKHQEVCGSRTEHCNTCNRNGDESGREEDDRGREAHMSRRVLLTVAITGIAVLIGSVFLQKRLDSHQ